MARIRSIKPEFCTSDQLADCSPTARLLFVLMWMHCDDGGVHQASEKRLRMECFPGDSFSKEQVREWIDELITAGLLAEFEAHGERYWYVTGWEKHQKIDKPTYRYPGPLNDKNRVALSEKSPSPPRDIPEPSPPERSGGESKGEEDSASLRSAEPSLGVVSPKEVVFRECLFALQHLGVADRQARSVLGKWRRDYGDSEVICVVTDAAHQGASEPIAYCERALRNRHGIKARDRPEELTAQQRILANFLKSKSNGHDRTVDCEDWRHVEDTAAPCQLAGHGAGAPGPDQRDASPGDGRQGSARRPGEP